MIVKIIVIAGLMATTSVAIAADKPSVALWDQQLVDKCIEGVNLSSAGATDPNRAAGSVYFKTVTPGSADAFQVFPLGLPITEGAAATPEKATCDLELRTMAGEGAEVLGVGKVGGSTEKLYHILVRQIGQRKVEYIVEDEKPRTPWNSKKYLSTLQSALFTKPTAAWGIDVVNIYLVTVEQFDKVKGDIKGGWGVVTANGNFQRTNGFNVAKVVLSGTPVLLNVSKILAADEKALIAPLATQGTGAVNTAAAPLPGTPVDPSSLKVAVESLGALIAEPK